MSHLEKYQHQDSAVNPLHPRALERLLMQRAIIKELAYLHGKAQEITYAELQKGQSLTITDANGVKLGTIGRSFPKPSAEVTDLNLVMGKCPTEQLEAYLPDSAMPQALEVLREHAPELFKLRPADYAMDTLRKNAIAHWERTGENLPGWRVTAKDGVVSIRTNKIAHERAAERVGELLTPTTRMVEEGK